jgi:hypothetical protein
MKVLPVIDMLSMLTKDLLLVSPVPMPAAPEPPTAVTTAEPSMVIGWAKISVPAEAVPVPMAAPPLPPVEAIWPPERVMAPTGLSGSPPMPADLLPPAALTVPLWMLMLAPYSTYMPAVAVRLPLNSLVPSESRVRAVPATTVSADLSFGLIVSAFAVMVTGPFASTIKGSAVAPLCVSV